MPLESLACTNCGSADVKEVKAETYFCNQCDSVFKYLDPGKVAAPIFCSCGNQVTARCQLCQVSRMCAACDATSSVDSQNILVQTVGFGYLLPDRSTWAEVRSGKVVPKRVSETMTIGPALPAVSLISYLFGIHGDLRHACWSCVASAVPNVSDEIATGIVCSEPFCSKRSRFNCRCCGSACCGVTNCGVHERAKLPGVRANTTVLSYYFPVKYPGSTCPRCVSKRLARLEENFSHQYVNVLRRDLVTNEYVVIPAGGVVHPGPKPRKVTQEEYDNQLTRDQALSRKAEHERQKELGKRCATELAEGLAQLPVSRAQHDYSIFDDSANTPAAAAPGVIGTP